MAPLPFTIDAFVTLPRVVDGYDYAYVYGLCPFNVCRWWVVVVVTVTLIYYPGLPPPAFRWWFALYTFTGDVTPHTVVTFPGCDLLIARYFILFVPFALGVFIMPVTLLRLPRCPVVGCYNLPVCRLTPTVVLRITLPPPLPAPTHGATFPHVLYAAFPCVPVCAVTRPRLPLYGYPTLFYG